ncbi:MAG: hypothetical protein LAP40_24745 [Acidobacteriia bacterium]|nr:hypothetical protein [Terriglobia bacterium]
MSSLQNATWPTEYQLFGGYASFISLASDLAISKIVLPDSTSYQFHYNEYGEIARVDLPTGGAYEFNWAFGPGSGNQLSGCPAANVVLATSIWDGVESSPNSACRLFAVYRRVNERREYADASNPFSWTRKTNYTLTELNPGTNVPGGDPLSLCASISYCTQVNVTETDPTLGVLASEVHYFYGAASQGLFPQEPGWYSWWVEGKEFHTERSSPQRIQLQTWQEPQAPSWWQAGESGTLGPEPENSSRVIQKNTVIDNGKLSQQSIYYTSDGTNSVSDLCEYDFGNTSGSLGALLRQTHMDYLNGYSNLSSSPPVYLLSLIQDQAVYAASSCTPYSPTGTMVAQTSYSYDGTVVSSNSGIVNNIYSTGFNARGNPTSATRWRNIGGPSATTATMYDQGGNATQMTNPRTYSTVATYDGCGSRYAFPHTVTNALNEQTTYTYDCDLGKPTRIQDPNGTVTAPSFNDPLNRLTQLVRAQGIGLENQTTYGYPDARTVSVQKDQYRDNDSNGIHSSSVADALGRTVQTQLATAQGTVITLTELDALGRAWKVHNPGYGGADSNVTTYSYDGQNRKVNIAYADGSAESFVWTGDTVLHTDPAGKKTQQQADALGRIRQVVEDPTGSPVTTTYGYDAQDDLTSVVRGSQARSFGYNSLKELVWASNPEVGQIAACNGSPGPVSACYTYDANGNLSTKVAAAESSSSIQTTYTYDVLDRVLTKSYSDGTPTVTYCYDGPCGGSPAAPSIGHLTSVSSSESGTAYTYDQLGRTLSSTQTTAGQTYPFGYTYNFADGLTRETYPSGRGISYFFEIGGRVMGVNGATTQYGGGSCSSGQPDTCSNPIQYAAHAAISSLRLGNTVTETWMYNNRLQPLQMQAGGLLTLGFGYTTGQNNGNLASQTITRGSQTWTQNYVYDALNRLAGPSNTQGALQENGATLQNYGYDQNGNWYLAYYDTSRISAPTIETPQGASWFSANNRINNWAYDGAGNEIGIPASAGSTVRAACAATTMPGVAMLRTSCFDAESRMTSETDALGVATTYAYDGDGNRVSKNVNGTVTTYVYDAMGNLAAEYGGQNTDTGTLYVSVDHLGSTRLITDNSGAQKYCFDYLPFGGDLFAGTDGRPSCYPTAHSSGIRFTGKERDAETGLDYFGARYFSGAQGRFTSPDWSSTPQPVPYADFANPQTLNLYTYGRNNPLRGSDPDGHCTVDKEEHGWLWCAAHAIGLTQTVKEQADDARSSLAQAHGFTINGQTPAEIAKNGTDQQVISADRAATKFLLGVAQEALSPCAPGVLCGVIPIGPPGEAGLAAEEGGIVAQNGTRINGFTSHGIDRVIGDSAKRAGTRPEAILDALRNPKKIVSGVDQQGRPFQVFTGKDARVIVNPQTGNIVSVNPESGAGAH